MKLVKPVRKLRAFLAASLLKVVITLTGFLVDEMAALLLVVGTAAVTRPVARTTVVHGVMILSSGQSHMAVTVMLGTTSETVLVMVCGGSVIVETNDETRVVKEVTVWVGTVRVSTDEVP